MSATATAPVTVTASVENTLVLRLSAADFGTDSIAAGSASQFVAVLPQPGLGSATSVVLDRVDETAFDRIAVGYHVDGQTFERTWTKKSDLGSTVTYTLLNSASDDNYVSAA